MIKDDIYHAINSCYTNFELNDKTKNCLGIYNIPASISATFFSDIKKIFTEITNNRLMTFYRSVINDQKKSEIFLLMNAIDFKYDNSKLNKCLNEKKIMHEKKSKITKKNFNFENLNIECINNSNEDKQNIQHLLTKVFNL
jgi:hypothetical protein